MTPTPAESEILISAANIFHRLRLPGLAGMVGDVIAGREIGHFVRSGKTDHEVVDAEVARREATAAAIRKRAEEHRYARRYHRDFEKLAAPGLQANLPACNLHAGKSLNGGHAVKKIVKVYLCNVQTIGAMCGYGEGKSREEAIENALEKARKLSTDGKAWYEGGSVCFAGGVNC